MPNHTILFTGTMIDAPDRKQPCFPPDKEAAVNRKIKAALWREKVRYSNLLQGIAGAACGGDILFQEACIELEISSAVYVTTQLCEFKKTSVAFAGQNWISRFDGLMQKVPFFFLPIVQKGETNIREATNEWLMKEAMRGGGTNITLIALWNGQCGDSPGSTQHFLDRAKANESTVIIIDI